VPALGGLGVVAALNVDNAVFSVHTDTATGKVTVTNRQLLDETIRGSAAVAVNCSTGNPPAAA
jgi:hypothetical protein